LSPSQAAELCHVALVETVDAMRGGPFELVLFYAGCRDYFAAAFPDLALVPQGEGDLGARMERAFERLLADGSRPAALIGSDSPDLPPARVAAALDALGESEVVTVPADDGGYVLIGESRHHPELFRGISWSSAAVLEETRQRVVETGIAYRELPGWEDIDDWSSLKRLCRRSPDSRTARYAASLPISPATSFSEASRGGAIR
jgi:rSAM/selenodomain-associated transferase 1